MSSPYPALNQRPFHSQPTSSSSSSSPQPSRRQSKITVEYHRPSRESIKEYNDLLNDANRQAAAAATAASYSSPYSPARQAPPPPTTVSTTNSPGSTIKSKSPIDTSNPHHRVRNSLQKPNPATRTRKGSLPSTPLATRTDTDPFSSYNLNDEMTAPPPRPSRANTATLNDIYTPESPLSARRLSSPNVTSPDAAFYADPSESMPSAPSQEYNSISAFNTGPRSRSNTNVKGKKGGMLSFMSDFLNQSKRIEISTPYDPVHLTHVGFNSSTGEFTGLPKEWQQLLQESGISRQDQEKNPQAVMEIVKFYQEGVHGDVWDKMGLVESPTKEVEQNGFQSTVSPNLFPACYTTDVARQRAAPPPPGKPLPPISVPSMTPTSPAPTSYRPAPAPPSAVTPSLDRSTSQRTPQKSSKSSDSLARANTTQNKRTPAQSPGSGLVASGPAPKAPIKHSPSSSTGDLKHRERERERERDPRAVKQEQPQSPAVQSLAKASSSAAGVATPRRREKKGGDKEFDIVARLKQICTDADPTRLYRNLVKIGQG